MVIGEVNFKDPRQKMWGILKNNTLISLPYGNETNETGNEISNYVTNCYSDALTEIHLLIAQGTASANIQLVEFVPYDYIMQPRV